MSVLSATRRVDGKSRKRFEGKNSFHMHGSFDHGVSDSSETANQTRVWNEYSRTKWLSSRVVRSIKVARVRDVTSGHHA